MGLKTTNYEVKELGLSLATAYAQITNLTVDKNGRTHAVFTIQKNREDINNKKHLDMKFFACEIDKTLPIYEQVYNKAKKNGIFEGWEDDIVD